jgi:serine/threonine protein kinase
MGWVKSVLTQYPGKPAFIILSSVTNMTPMIAQQMAIAIKHGVSNFYFKQKLDMEHFVGEISSIMEEVVAREREQAKANEEEDPFAAYEAYKKSLEETANDVGLALEMVQGHRQWPFTIDEILAGKALMGGYYKILAYLGEDNSASTFKAKEPDQEEPIALKIINRVRMSGDTIPSSFDKNFREIADLDHPNIVRLLHYEIIEDRMIVATEFLQGGRLDEKLEQHHLPEELAIHYFRQLLEGMSELHKIGLQLHQVIPRQIMFRDDQTLVITQIGLLSSLHALSEVAGDWPLPFATPVYTTPEYAQKGPTDLRSDVYLAGLIGYEMLAGKPPFSQGSDQDILYAHAAEPVPPLTNSSHPVNKVLQEILHKIPDSRPQNATEALKLMNQLVK